MVKMVMLMILEDGVRDILIVLSPQPLCAAEVEGEIQVYHILQNVVALSSLICYYMSRRACWTSYARN